MWTCGTGFFHLAQCFQGSKQRVCSVNEGKAMEASGGRSPGELTASWRKDTDPCQDPHLMRDRALGETAAWLSWIHT